MKTIFKIVIGLALVTAAFNASRAALNDYQFQEEVQQALLFNPRASDEDITTNILKIANEYEVPITAEGITVRLLNQDVHVDMHYTTNVMLLPGVISKEWTFSPSVSARILAGAALPQRRR